MGTVVNTVSEINMINEMVGSVEMYKRELKPYEGKIDPKEQLELRKKMEIIRDKYRYQEKLTEEEKELDEVRIILNSYYYLNTNPKYTINNERYTLAEIKSELDKGNEDSYEYRNLEQAYKYISKAGKPQYAYRNGWNMITDFRVSATMIVILVLLGVSTIFSDEYKTNVIPLILSSPNGRKKLTVAKIFSSMIYATGVVVFVSTVYLLSGLPFGLDGFNSMLNNGSSWIQAPYPMKMIEFYFIGLGMSLLGALVITLIIALASLLTKNSMITFALGFGIYLFVSSPFAVILPEVIRKISIYELMRVKDVLLFYNSFNIFGKPVLYPTVIIIVTLLMIPMLVSGIRYYGRRQSI